MLKPPYKALMGGGKRLAKDGFWLKIVLEGFDDLDSKLGSVWFEN